MLCHFASRHRNRDFLLFLATQARQFGNPFVALDAFLCGRLGGTLGGDAGFSSGFQFCFGLFAKTCLLRCGTLGLRAPLRRRHGLTLDIRARCHRRPKLDVDFTFCIGLLLRLAINRALIGGRFDRGLLFREFFLCRFAAGDGGGKLQFFLTAQVCEDTSALVACLSRERRSLCRTLRNDA